MSRNTRAVVWSEGPSGTTTTSIRCCTDSGFCVLVVGWDRVIGHVCGQQIVGVLAEQFENHWCAIERRLGILRAQQWTKRGHIEVFDNISHTSIIAEYRRAIPQQYSWGSVPTRSPVKEPG
ncbi:unnamed protein product [Ectocarpus sp. 12 AP-2014]